MNVLVYPHELSMGGSQINAIDLAAEIGKHGHEAVVYALDGPLRDYVAQRGLRYIEANPLHYRPGPTRIPQIHRIVRREGIDLIHAYEWPPALDAFYGARLPLGTPVICTVLTMAVSPLIPSSMPLIMGTEQLGEQAREDGHPDVGVLEPPIDTEVDTPDTDGQPWRRSLGIGDDEVAVVSVSRLSIDLKLDALVDAVDAAAILARQHAVRVVLVGDGDAAAELHRRAAHVNAEAGREVVILPGNMMDPRPAYAGADIVIGMGSSALRAMAHAKPLVVQGEHGWALPCTEDTLPTFLWQGFWGVGDGSSAASALAGHLAPLIEDPDHRRRLGAWGRQTVLDRFSLVGAGAAVAKLYDEAAAAPPATRKVLLRDAIRSARLAAALELHNHRPRNKRQTREDKATRLSDAARPTTGAAP